MRARKRISKQTTFLFLACAFQYLALQVNGQDSLAKPPGTHIFQLRPFRVGFVLGITGLNIRNQPQITVSTTSITRESLTPGILLGTHVIWQPNRIFFLQSGGELYNIDTRVGILNNSRADTLQAAKAMIAIPLNLGLRWERPKSALYVMMGPQLRYDLGARDQARSTVSTRVAELTAFLCLGWAIKGKKVSIDPQLMWSPALTRRNAEPFTNPKQQINFYQDVFSFRIAFY